MILSLLRDQLLYPTNIKGTTDTSILHIKNLKINKFF